MLVLRPSAIHGIGVYTTAAIGSGEHLRLWQPDDWRFLTFAEAEQDPDVRAVREIYCVRDGTGYHCPLDFHRMSIGWYMNFGHSECRLLQGAELRVFCRAPDRRRGGYRLRLPHANAL